ncbi:flavin reductase family protein [Amycolatopsis thermoflava]|uniref:Flavin reductase (DIM6/NTAB) family NADH-FMN oxidoreductase RutF n=1 Tax=Amycolatopsis thermoflava TaxID=84480 RepID=A0A3N2H5X6_9PSEU|nr:flavin reductase family protein [Amycolatopsis thermoflava]ROS44313.1 flavin reductase (DIM6/NTAB) family NADH-FMN oxidoreductase RutF [Amycolatopsis thermoflava]
MDSAKHLAVPAEANDEVFRFRQAISRFSTGVAVITTRTAEGPAGMTASAVASLSLDPLRLLVCIGSTLPTRQAIIESGQFAVNVLGEGHEHIAKHFATRRKDKFAGIELRTDSDIPVLTDAIAHFVCAVAETLPGGDHTIVVGDVLRCGHVPGTNPLVYFASAFGTLHNPATHSATAGDWHFASAM